MQERAGIRARLAQARAAAQGDGLGLLRDWRSLAIVADSALRVYTETGSADDAARYLKVIEAIAPVVGARDASEFRARHRALVCRLAPGSLAEAALSEPPSLGEAAGAIEKLASLYHLKDYRAPPAAEGTQRWVEPAARPGQESSAPVARDLRVGIG